LAICECVVAADAIGQLLEGGADFSACECLAGNQDACQSDFEAVDGGDSMLNDFLNSPMVSSFFMSYGLEMP
jgi:hypothetical protein